MPSKSSAAPSRKRAISPADEVDAFLAALEHPRKDEIVALRRIILAADPNIAEGIKWNAPSFRTSDYFATVHLRTTNGVQVVLHRGAKKRANPDIDIDDPASLLEWHGGDRASALFRDLADVVAKRAAFAELLRQWIKHV
jgi:hypothetical protein